jgi:hypothetical protein
MKNRAVVYLLFFIFLLVDIPRSGAQITHPEAHLPYECPELQEPLNLKKNYSAEPPGRQPEKWDIAAVIHAEKHEDNSDFTEGTYVYLTGYIVKFAEQGPEKCNCGEASKPQKNGDVHIYIGLEPDAALYDCVVVEITPDYKRLHPDYAEHLSKGAQATISGYLFYDEDHRPAAINTCTSCGKPWRKTCWEIHPIISIE